jgi:hypothetical protein
MNLDGFGRTLLFVLAIFFLFIFIKKAFALLDPYTRKVSPAVADFIATA